MEPSTIAALGAAGGFALAAIGLAVYAISRTSRATDRVYESARDYAQVVAEKTVEELARKDAEVERDRHRANAARLALDNTQLGASLEAAKRTIKDMIKEREDEAIARLHSPDSVVAGAAVGDLLREPITTVAPRAASPGGSGPNRR
jgi:hypothetical protein